jgi:hypothetical protein
MDWWENDPYLSSKAADNNTKALEEENKKLQERLESLEKKLDTNRLNTAETK